jgi:beta-lactamase regulating signal transducer with metallopeptidase domain
MPPSGNETPASPALKAMGRNDEPPAGLVIYDCNSQESRNMNALEMFYPGDHGVRLASSVAVQITVVFLGALAVARRLGPHRAAWRHAWLFWALVAVLASPVVTIVADANGWALFHWPVVTEPTATSSHERTPAGPAAMPLVAALPSLAESAHPPIAPRTEREDIIASRSTAPPENTAAAFRTSGLRMLGGAAVVVWLTGVLSLFLRLVIGFAQLRRLRRSVEPADEAPWATLLVGVRQTLRTDRLPPIALSCQTPVPVTAGVVRPLVILPMSLPATLSAERLRDVLIHECAHAIRRDHVVGLMRRLAQMLFWPHPLVHRLNRELTQACEELCDNHVLRAGDRVAYARTLLEVTERFGWTRPAVGVLGLLQRRQSLEDRVHGILDPRRTLVTGLGRMPAAAIACVLLLLRQGEKITFTTSYVVV